MRARAIVVAAIGAILRKTHTNSCSSSIFWSHVMDTIDEIKSTGLKATLPRMKILEIFQKSGQRHMAAEDVYRHLLAEKSDIGLATVYRVLMQFEQAGILTRSHFEATKAIYELRGEQHHDHLVCLDCGRVEEFFDPEIERRQNSVAKKHGFSLSEHALSLYGHCTKNACEHRDEAPEAAAQGKR